jgi:hypothetical protein
VHLSATGYYIARILHDLKRIRDDGSTEVGMLANLRLTGRLDNTVGAFLEFLKRSGSKIVTQACPQSERHGTHLEERRRHT